MTCTNRIDRAFWRRALVRVCAAAYAANSSTMSTPNPSPNGPRFEPLWPWKTCVLCSDAQESPTDSFRKLFGWVLLVATISSVVRPNLSMPLADPLIDDGSSFLRAASGIWSSCPCSSAGNTSSLLPTIQKRLAPRSNDGSQIRFQTHRCSCQRIHTSTWPTASKNCSVGKRSGISFDLSTVRLRLYRPALAIFLGRCRCGLSE